MKIRERNDSVGSTGGRFTGIWFAFSTVLALLVRFGTDSGYGLSAFSDDLGLALGGLALLAALRKYLPALWGGVVLTAIAGFLILATTVNELYHETFHSWIGLHSLGAVEELDDIQSSISSLLTLDVILCWFGIPLIFLAALMQSWRHWRPRHTVVWGILGIVILGLGSLNREDVASVRENHFLLSALRLEARRVIRNQGAYDPTGVLEGVPLDTLVAPMSDYVRVGGTEQPLLQAPREPQNPQKRPNIIIIEAESYRSAESGAYGAVESLTPEFDKLAESGLRAQNFYATGIQTVRGELSILCSTYPALGTSALYKRVPTLDLTCLPQILGANGYENHWFSAYKANYAGKRAFLESHGFDFIHGVEAHGQPDDVHVGWGISDKAMADRILESLERARKPFLATWITLSNHHPWNWDFQYDFPDTLQVTPESEDYEHYRRGVYYTDHALGYFVSQLREKPWGKDAWLVIVGDHGMHIFPNSTKRTDLAKLEAQFRVPFLILAPGAVEPGVVMRPASQVDVAPTLLDLMGMRVANAFVGQSILRPDGDPASPVLMVGENAASLVVDDERCMIAEVTCYENAQPQCGQGEKPTPASHICFSPRGDLLFEHDVVMDRLAPARSATLRTALSLLPAMQSHLEAHNRLGAGAEWESSLSPLSGLP